MTPPANDRLRLFHRTWLIVVLLSASLEPLAHAATNLFSASQANASSDLAAVRQMLGNKSVPRTWILTGDSITHGAKHTGGSRSYVEYFAERLRWEMGRGRDIVINTGLSGDTAEGLLRELDWRIARFKPDVVSVMIGMNDCTRGPARREEFRSNLRKLVAQIRGIGAIPLLHTHNTVQPAAAAQRGDLPAYAEIVAEVAREQQIILVDHWTHWKTAAADAATRDSWLNDPLHPNWRGHRELAILMFRTLEMYSPDAPTCQPLP